MPPTDSLRFALVNDWHTAPGGAEDVFRQICDLYSGIVFTSQWDRKRMRFIAGREVQTSALKNMPWALREYYFYARLLPCVYRNFRLDNFDVILSNSHSFAHGVNARPGALHICYYHTPERLLWRPEVDDRGSSNRIATIRRFVAERIRRLDLEASRKPQVIFANSQTTAGRIRRFYGRDVNQVIYPPVDTHRWADVHREADDAGLIYWGRLVRNKRVDLIIEAVRQTKERLQIVGSGPQEAALKTQAMGLSNVTFHGRLEHEELKRLMGRCRASVFPAYEDFGIGTVEAMAAGLPVVCYGVGGGAESVPPEYGIRFGIQSVDALTAALRALTTRNFDEVATRAHAAKFDVLRFRMEYQTAVDRAIERHYDGKK